MDGQDDLAHCLVNVGDDVGDERAEETLASAHGHARRVPCGLEILTQSGKVGRSGGRVRHPHRRQLRFAGFNATERRLPALLELRGDQAVIGIAGSVAPFRERCFIAGLLQLEFHDALLFIPSFHIPASGLHCCLDRHRLDRAEQLSGDRGVDTETAEREAPGQPKRQVRPITAVDGLTRRTARVAYHQAASAAATGKQPSQQGSAAAPRLRPSSLAIGVDGKLLLVPFELRPVDIPVVVILQKNLPLLKRLAVAVALPRTSIDDLGALLAFAVGVSPGIKRVLEHGDDIAVADRRPVKADQPLAIGRPREVDLLTQHQQKNLPRAAQLAEAGEDQPDHFLDPKVGIKAETDLAMPDIADGHANTQFAAARLGASGVEHARTQHAEFELTDGALHAEQEPIVRPAGIIDPVQIDYSRLDQAAELQKMMPVAAVAGEPGGVDAQHGPDVPGAQPGHQPLKAGPRHHPTGGAAEIVIDHFDFAKTLAPSDLDELVLAPLALEVVLDLGLGGLPNIYDRFALQHCGRQEISARHLHAPRPRCRPPPTGGASTERVPCVGPKR